MDVLEGRGFGADQDDGDPTFDSNMLFGFSPRGDDLAEDILPSERLSSFIIDLLVDREDVQVKLILGVAVFEVVLVLPCAD